MQESGLDVPKDLQKGFVGIPRLTSDRDQIINLAAGRAIQEPQRKFSWSDPV
jgi:hypothetical protein